MACGGFLNVHFPPMSALRAFEAAARHLSFSRAAEELHVTQSAISHQIRHLEELWDVRLFERRGRRLALTLAGHSLAPVVRDFVQRLRTILQEFKNDDRHEALRISLLQSFAFKWLVPRLGHFNQAHPDIEVWLSTAEELIDLTQGQADIAIRLGRGKWAGLHSTFLLREYVFPVCSPYFLEHMTPPEKPADLIRYPLLRRYIKDITPRWRDWFHDAGVEIQKMPRGTLFSDSSMALQAALDGQGVALARSAHVADDLKAGRLVKLFDVYSESTVAYYAVCLQGRQHEIAIAAFRDWLLDEAKIAQAEFDATIANQPLTKNPANGSHSLQG
jgi:LysR family glycine cleavage system transcriptional activator